MSTEDEIIRIAKKMDKMVQKKNAKGVVPMNIHDTIYIFC